MIGAIFRSFERNKDVLELDFHDDTCCDKHIQICFGKEFGRKIGFGRIFGGQ